MFFRLDTDGSGKFKRGPPVIHEPLIRDHHVDLRDPEACGKPWSRSLRCRRPLHNAFFQWYATNEDKLSIKLELRKHTGTCLDIGFCGINPILTAHLIHNGLNVSVVPQGTYWDMILDLMRSQCPSLADMCVICASKNSVAFSRLSKPFGSTICSTHSCNG